MKAPAKSWLTSITVIACAAAVSTGFTHTYLCDSHSPEVAKEPEVATASTGKTPDLPAYGTHQIVWAGKIAKVVETDTGALLTLIDGLGDVEVDADYMRREQRDKIGGYLVIYKNVDGSWYTTWSPADVFEQGHSKL